ncbi:MAG: sigma-70 family RNA polymerase sigma factor [Bacteroidota bacterium]
MKRNQVMGNQQQKDAFIEMLEQHRKLLFKVASTYAKTEEDRKDLIQEITLQLWRSFNKYDGRVKFSTWIYRIALNVSISSFRKEKKRYSTSPLKEEIVITLKDESFEERAEQVKQLYTFIGQLKVIDKGIMLLYLEDKSHEEIGVILGLSKSNVGTRISRIKKKLKDYFELINKQHNV